jgi:hypothetical protein
MEDDQCFELEQGSTTKRHANLSSVMEEMRQANETLNKRCLGGNPRIRFMYLISVFYFKYASHHHHNVSKAVYPYQELKEL